MTYLQLMTKCLKFFKGEKEKFDINSFYFHWLASSDDNIDLYYKAKAQKAILYLILLEIKNNSNKDNPLLNALEKELSYFDISLFKTIEKMEEKTLTSIIEDSYMFDQICLLEQEEITEEKQNEIINELLSESQVKMPEKWEVEQYESAIHTVMEMVSQIIPELFFTERGYKYIGKEFQIDDTDLRERCHMYLQDNIKYYNDYRIYKVDESIYRKLYEDDDEVDEFEETSDEDDFDNIFLDEDEIRGQVDIYDEDIDNYDILYYSVTLLTIILRFVKNKEYDKIEKLIELDEEMTHFHGSYGAYCDKTLIESIYQPKTMDNDFNKEISTSFKSDSYLDFFLSDNEFTQQYSIKQLALIITYCFDAFDSGPINKLYKNIDIINTSLSSFDNNKEVMSESIKQREKMIKRLVKIKKDNRQD